MIGRLENHFPTAGREPQLEVSTITANRHGHGRDGPGLAAFAAGSRGAGDRRALSLVDLGQRLIGYQDGQTPFFVFQEIGKYLDFIVAGINAIRAPECPDDQRGFARANRHGAGINHENPVGRHRIGQVGCGAGDAQASGKKRQQKGDSFHRLSRSFSTKLARGSTCAEILRPGFALVWGVSAGRTFSAQFVVFMVTGTQRNFVSARAMHENLNRPSCGDDGV